MGFKELLHEPGVEYLIPPWNDHKVGQKDDVDTEDHDAKHGVRVVSGHFKTYFFHFTLLF